MNGLLVILCYLSYKRASKYPLSLVSKIGGDDENCGLGGEEVHAKTTNSGYSIPFYVFFSVVHVVGGRFGDLSQRVVLKTEL